MKPVYEHLKLGSGKRWLRHAFASKLPKNIWNRRKQGFGVPIHEWFRGELGDRFRERIRQNPGVISPEIGLRILEEHQDGKRDNGYRLWMMFAYLMFSQS